MTEENKSLKLAERICAIMKKTGAIKKDANMNNKYDYISAEKLNSVISELLTQYALVVYPNAVKVDDTEIKTSGNKSAIRSVVHMKFKIVCADTGESEEFLYPGSDYDGTGKSLSQAITSAHKGFLSKLFFVHSEEGGNSPEMGSDFPNNNQARQSNRQPQGQQQNQGNQNTNQEQRPQPQGQQQNQGKEPLYKRFVAMLIEQKGFDDEQLQEFLNALKEHLGKPYHQLSDREVQHVAESNGVKL